MEKLKQLGSGKTEYPTTYTPGILEWVPSPGETLVHLDCPEFTSLCPVTAQPDFAHIDIYYVPAERLVESKSLKLYLFSFRGTGEFHETCVQRIMEDLRDLLQPKWLLVRGRFMPRGGISIWPIAEHGDHKLREWVNLA